MKGQTASNLTSIMLRSLLLELLKCAPALKPSDFSWEHTSWRWATNRGEAPPVRPLNFYLSPLARSPWEVRHKYINGFSPNPWIAWTVPSQSNQKD